MLITNHKTIVDTQKINKSKPTRKPSNHKEESKRKEQRNCKIARVQNVNHPYLSLITLNIS